MSSKFRRRVRIQPTPPVCKDSRPRGPYRWPITPQNLNAMPLVQYVYEPEGTRTTVGLASLAIQPDGQTWVGIATGSNPPLMVVVTHLIDHDEFMAELLWDYGSGWWPVNTWLGNWQKFMETGHAEFNWTSPTGDIRAERLWLTR